jgi:hypothetical protein
MGVPCAFVTASAGSGYVDMECARRFFPRSPVLVIIMDMTPAVVELAAFPPLLVRWEEDLGGDEYECPNDRAWHSFGGLRGWSRKGEEADAHDEDRLAARGRCPVGFDDADARAALEAEEEAELKKEEGSADVTKG